MRLLVIAVAGILSLNGCAPSENQSDESQADAKAATHSNATEQVAGVEARFARLALDCVHRQYPNKISHVLGSDDDAKTPKELYPAFYGCFDWHSAVHGHWMLTRLWGQGDVPDMDAEIAESLSQSFTAENIAVETAYIEKEGRGSFERPYGVAWYLQLMSELNDVAKGTGTKADQARQWQATLKPLETAIIGKVKTWVPKLHYPIRLGTHNQSAFAFGLMLDWARTSGDDAFEKMLVQKTLAFHEQDKNCPMGYEPSGEDFLSPCLMEADLMRRVMPQDKFAAWLSDFLPQIPTDAQEDWLKAGVVTDASDGKLAHLDGVNLSRAWALEGIASGLPTGDSRIAALLASARYHKKLGIAAVSAEHYAGSHWLASFATYLVTQRGLAEKVD